MKYHNNLDDSQIHNAKGFAPARVRSVSTKDSAGSVVWAKGNYTSSVAVTTIADVGGRLHHTYFCLYNSNDATKYAVYFDVSSVAAFTTPSGYGGTIQVNCTATGDDSTAVQIAGYLHTAINGHADFSSADDSAGAVGTVTITGLETASPSVDVGTGFSIIITDTEITDEVLITDSSGNIEWTPQSNLRRIPIKMQGYGTTQSGGNTGFYEYRAELSDAQSPYEFVSDYGSATMGSATITQKDAFRTDGFVCPLAMSLHTITGWATGSLSSDLTIGLAKVTPSDSGASALTPVLLDEITVTCAGNTRTRSFSVAAGAMTVTALAQGDIIMPFIKTEIASVVYYFNFTIFADITG